MTAVRHRIRLWAPLLAAGCALLAPAQESGAAPAPAKSASPIENLARWFSADVRALQSRRDELLRRLESLPPPPVEQQSERLGYHSRFSSSPDGPVWIAIDLGSPEPIDAVVLAPCNVAYGTHPGPGYGFPARFKVELSFEPAFTNAFLLAGFTAQDFPSPGDLPVWIPAEGRTARYIRVTATRLWSRGDSFLFALSEIMVLQGARNIAAGAPAQVSNAYENPPAWTAANATDGQSVLGPPVILERPPGNGYHSVEGATEPDRVGWVQVDLGRSIPIDEIRLFPARPNDFPARRGFGFPVRFRVEASDDPEFTDPILIADHTGEDFLNPAENPVVFRVTNTLARFVRVTATRWWHRNHDYVFALAEMAVYSGNENAALGAPVKADARTAFYSWRDEYLVDGYTSQGRILEWPEWLRGLSERREALLQLAPLSAQHQRLAARALRRAALVATLLILAAFFGFLAFAYRSRLKRDRELGVLRARIAADLHDEIGSNIGSIALLSRMLQSDLRLAGDSRQTLQEIQRTASETLDSMREIVWLIHPGQDRLGELSDRLRDFARNMLADTECTFEMLPGAGSARLPLETRRNLCLIFKELLHNIAKHARASRVHIALGEQDGRFHLRVRDDGIGFDPVRDTSGRGLDNLRRRVEKVGGELTIKSEPGRGTSVGLRVPIH